MDILEQNAETHATSLEARIRARAEVAGRSFEPHLFDLAQAADREAFEGLLASERPPACLDTLPDQLADLLRAREPARKFTPEEIHGRMAAHLDGCPMAEYGTWVHYPWSGRLVHLLPMAEFRELRTDRNRYKIDTEEQRRLGRARIGVIGQSVGNAVALTLAMEGVGGELRIADPDTLGLSNLNRLRAGVADLGRNKAVLAARQIAEIDPYLKVRVYPLAVDEASLSTFLLEGGPLDLLFDECDDLFTKVRCRERAREMRIPVLMSTDDRGLIDVERFDREPGRPLFHGLAGHLDAAAMKGLDKTEKVPYVLRIVGEDGISSRMAASLVEIDETISSFPQLASEAALGGAIATHVARRVLLGEMEASGRWYVDIDEVVRPGQGVAIPEEAAPLGVVACEEALSTPAVGPLVAGRSALAPEDVRSIVSYGVLAPSAHNGQPWRFHWADGCLRAIHDPERSEGFLDYGHGAAYLAFGAAVENMVLAAAGMGFDTDVRLFPDAHDPLRVCDLRFDRAGEPRPDPLLDAIPLRATNRRRGPRTPLEAHDSEAMDAAVIGAGGRLQWLTRPDDLDAIGELLGVGDRVAYLSKHMHAYLMAGIRWTPEEVEATRDGIDVATMELSAADVAGLKIVSRWTAMKLVGLMGSGRVLENVSRKVVAAASGVGLITVRGQDPGAFFQGGRAMERAWLTATARGLAFQPLAMLPYMFARLEHGRGEGFTEDERRTLSRLRADWRRLFDIPEGWCEPILFRVAQVGAPSARALRRHVDDVLTFG